MRDQGFYNLVATLAAVVAISVVTAVPGFSSSGSAPAAGAARTSRVNLTVSLNGMTGWPQFVPANFSVPVGPVVITIVDQDAPMSWPACSCRVAGTVGGFERVNGTAESQVSDSNVAHTFTVPSLGLNVLSPGASTVTFTIDLPHAGSFPWFCEAPCGSNGYEGPPMGVPGYMTGTITVD